VNERFHAIYFSAMLILLAFIQAAPADCETTMPINGTSCRGMSSFEKHFCAYLHRENIPAASLTIAYKGKIIFSRAYGYSNLEQKVPLLPGDRFRIASLSKSITAVGILSLCENEKLKPDDKAFSILSDIKPCEPNYSIDPRIKDIRVRDLLQCSAGWEHEGIADPIFAKWLGTTAVKCTNNLRPSNIAIIRNLLMQKLDYDPGTTYSYSNVSYCVLGQIIEKITSQKYADFINALILQPENLQSFAIGSTLNSSEHEVKYYPEESAVVNLLPNYKDQLGAANGGFFMLEAAPATIGWIASTDDLVRFISILSGETKIDPPINKKTFEQMLARPALDYWKTEPEYFAFGWEVERNKNGQLIAFSRHGSLPGTMALIEHQSNGISWAAAFNKRPLRYVERREEVKALIKKSVKELLPQLSKGK
jgi:CubicO group peptidase (beta-lactamase class C family)